MIAKMMNRVLPYALLVLCMGLYSTSILAQCKDTSGVLLILPLRIRCCRKFASGQGLSVVIKRDCQN